MPNIHKLPLVFDTGPLQAELRAISSQSWAEHFNTNYFDGDWSGVALRSLSGDPTRLYPDPHSSDEIADTPVLEACPNIRKVLEAFVCEIKSARLLRLGPGSSIKEHRDYDLGRETGEIRLHIPLITNERVEFYLAGRLVNMKEGECWYLNFNLPHRVENRGSTARVHLVIDCVINDWLDSLLPPEETDQTVEFSSRPQLEEFRRHVLNNVELQGRLRTTEDRQSFVGLVVDVGRECGYIFGSHDVNDALREERRNVHTTWIP
jgi:hypothetical protein